MVEYPWYCEIGGKEILQQGDFIKDLPIYLPKVSTAEEITADVLELNVIILSQSCDLEHKKILTVMVCPYKPYSEFVKENSHYGSADGKKQLHDANVIRFHLLDKCEIEKFKSDFLIVDFSNTFSVPVQYLEKHSQKYSERLRLLPPYREQLAQNFARFFMRVGLPHNIENFVEKPKKSEGTISAVKTST